MVALEIWNEKLITFPPKLKRKKLLMNLIQWADVMLAFVNLNNCGMFLLLMSGPLGEICAVCKPPSMNLGTCDLVSYGEKGLTVSCDCFEVTLEAKETGEINF